MVKQFLKILLFTYVISFIIGILSLLIIYHPDPGTHDGGQLIFLMIVGGLYVNFLLTLSSLTIFFGLSEEVRHSLILRSLSFFLLPFFVALYFLLFAQELPFIIMSAVYLLVLLYFFLQLNKTPKGKELN